MSPNDAKMAPNGAKRCPMVGTGAQPGHEVWPLSPSQTESDQTPHGSSLQMGPLGTDGTQIFALYHLWVWPMCDPWR